MIPSPDLEQSTARAKLTLGGYSWALFEAARNPYYLLVVVYVFMPYVSSIMVGDGVRGQETISYWAQIAGIIVMFTSPLLGASVDAAGRRKPWLAPCVAVMVVGIAALWWAKPDGSGLTVNQTMSIVLLLTVLFSYGEVLYNSMLVPTVGLPAAHTASSYGLAIGSAFSLVSLVFVAWAFALPGRVDWAFVPAVPLFGLDTVAHEQDRVVAPISALILALGSIPLFLFTPDPPSKGHGQWAALRGSVMTLWGTIMSLRQNRDAAIFLVARMAFFDGMVAIILYLGVFSSGVMRWSGLELLILGMINAAMATVGGLSARWLDATFGPRRALLVELGIAITCITGLIGMGREQILWIPWPTADASPVWSGPIFTTVPEITFLLIAMILSIVIMAHFSSSRTLLTRLTPAERTGAFFGLYALSGTATTWLGSMLVNFGTRVAGTQQGGFLGIIVLLVLGTIGLLFVRGGNRWTGTRLTTDAT